MSFENYPMGAVEGEQCLGVVAGLPEDPSLVSSTHPRQLTISYNFRWRVRATWHAWAMLTHTYTEIKINLFQCSYECYRDGSGTKVLATQACGPDFRPLHPHKMWSLTAHTCNPNDKGGGAESYTRH